MLLFATYQLLHRADLGFQLLAIKMALQPVDPLELFSVASNCYGIAVTLLQEALRADFAQ